jgi:hypothetical protein
VEPPSEEGLARATAILGEPARVLSIAPGSFYVSGFDNVVEALTAIIVRHPMEEEALLRALSHWPPGHVTETLARLTAEGDAQVVSRYGKRFWSSRKARYQPHTTRKSVKALRS